MKLAIAQQANHCFLSYSRADGEFALRLASDLSSLGVAMWVDRLDIRPSEHWDRAIERAIRGCRNMVVILSPRAVASENVADEVSLAVDAGKPIIPVMIEPCQLPLRLTRKHLIEVTGGYEGALQQCFAEIESGEGDRDRPVPEGRRGVDDQQIVASAKRELACFVGPIAEILVERAASRAASVEGLYRLLALHIDKETDRQIFIAARSAHALVPDHSPAEEQTIHPSDLERIATALASYLGPIALVLTRQEGAASASIKELLERLAARVRSERDRADFLHRAQTQ
jgi:hypothetical protein